VAYNNRIRYNGLGFAWKKRDKKVGGYDQIENENIRDMIIEFRHFYFWMEEKSEEDNCIILKAYYAIKIMLSERRCAYFKGL
jgi:hypothetical protein